VPVALRLFLPDDWIKQPDRCRDAGVPEWGKNGFFVLLCAQLLEEVQSMVSPKLLP
jgi:hypothetical protein